MELHNLARLVCHSVERQLDKGMAEHGVSPGQWRLLRRLRCSNSISQHRLAEQLAISDATATLTLRELERKGMVDRRRNAENRREVLIVLTRQGHALERTLLPIVDDVHRLAARNISPSDIATLEGLLRRVIANLDRFN